MNQIMTYKKQRGAQPGSANARRSDVSATAHVHIRCTELEKTAWKKAADDLEISISELARNGINSILAKRSDTA